MKVIDYFNCDRPEYWRRQIKKSDWEAGQLFRDIEKIAKEEKVQDIFISTNHTGLYEKYGCEFYQKMHDMDGEPSRVYRKHVNGNRIESREQV